MSHTSRRFIFVAVLALIGLDARAHHSPAAFDQQRHLTLQAVVRTLEWANPHVYLHVTTKNDVGEDVLWTIEAQSPRVMSMFGWSPASLRPGDRVTVAAHPLRDGDRPVALGRLVEKQDGTALKISWQRDEIREALRREGSLSDPP